MDGDNDTINELRIADDEIKPELRPMADEWRQTDRKRGILTKGDREYLLGEKSLEGQDEINTRYRIRQRVIQSLLDIYLLTHYLGGEDKKQIANDDRVSTNRVRYGVTKLAYDLLHDNENISDPMAAFEPLIKEAISVQYDPMDNENVSENHLLQIYGDVDIDFGYEKLAMSETGFDSDTVNEAVMQSMALTENTDMTLSEALRRTVEEMGMGEE